jgi:hypothetical protein
MSGIIRMAGRGLLAAAVVAGLAGLGVTVPAVASSRIVPGIGLSSPARGAAGAVQAAVIRASAERVTAARAGGKAVPGFGSGIVPPARADLGSISCPAASFCVAVGGLAEEWNGRSWRVMPTPRRVGLFDVSCASARFCMAAGTGPMQRWDGRRWTAVRTPPGAGDLLGVSCLSASFCLAVGTDSPGPGRCPTGAVWRGTAWHATRMPGGICGSDSNSHLDRVSCASASDCIAIGGIPVIITGDEPVIPLAMQWNGRTWHALSLPAGTRGPDSELSGVSCPDTSFCLAVGVKLTDYPNSDYRNMALAWDGTTWTELSTPPGPVGSGVSGVWCASAGRCVAVGGDQASTWNGSAWTGQAIAKPESAGLGSISCWQRSACMAAGSYSRLPLPDAQPHSPNGAQLTLAEQWNGSTWQPRRTPTPGDEQEGLSGLSCRSPANCMAVGAYINGSDVQAALAERWNGRAWKVLTAPDPGPGENVLTAISCPAADQCIAVGYYDAAGSHQALAEQWNGSAWTRLPVPHDGVLTGVSCPAVNNCMAVGTYVSNVSRGASALSVTWDGSTWTPQASPAPGGVSEFNAVACPSRTRCIAVGDYATFDGRPPNPLTALWNGTAWTMLTTPAPGANAANTLTSVSCSGPSNCMAVGRTYHTHPLPAALAESWNGTRWTVRPTPKLKIKPRMYLDAVSCPAPARCRAVGGYLTSTGGFMLAEAWNGATWRRLVPLTDPSPAFNGLYAISCPAARHCIAVGGTEIQRTLAYRWNGTGWQRLRTPTP